jgi:hypothetical protein
MQACFKIRVINNGNLGKVAVHSLLPSSYLERIKCFYSDILQAMLDLFLPRIALYSESNVTGNKCIYNTDAIFTFYFKLEHILAEKVMYIYKRKYELCHTDY